MIPDFQKIMRPLLEVIRDGRSYSSEQIVEMLRVRFNLTIDDLKETIPSGNQSLFRNRVDWACSHLRRADLIAGNTKGFYQITNSGLKVLLQNTQEDLNVGVLRRFESFQMWEDMFNQSDFTSAYDDGEMNGETPEIIIGKATLRLYQSLKFELLSLIKSKPLSFFEYFVVEFFRKIGYKGVETSNFSIIGQQDKEGIEGVLYQDELHIEKIYVQAKKWDVQVTSKDVRNFIGALNLKGTQKGVFITTSAFSEEAKVEALQNSNHTVILIDSDRLIQLAIRYNVGVQTKRIIEIKGIDDNF